MSEKLFIGALKKDNQYKLKEAIAIATGLINKHTDATKHIDRFHTRARLGLGSYFFH